MLGPIEQQSLTGSSRLLWIVNHRTLMSAEVPILRSLGWEVFVPKVVPDYDPSYRSAAVTGEYDQFLGLSSAELAILNTHDFYERPWSPTITRIINQNFNALIASFSFYVLPLSEAARKFSGKIMARVFGREHPNRYSDVSMTNRPFLLQELSGAVDRFIFAQGYANLAEIESEPLRSRAHTITVPLPTHIFEHADTWTGHGTKALFLCPAISDFGYYRTVYERTKKHFGDLPHNIFGRQTGEINDPTVLPYLSDDDLLTLYATAPVFCYPSPEPRHVHYSPIEAMVIGTPVLYMRSALIDILAQNADLPGACASLAEMRVKACRLLNGDHELAGDIRATQGKIVETFSSDRARRQWAIALQRGTEAM
jgi:hypothetical protein